ncbi:hypothetical protein C8Q76DRAFT_307613 [Earliella scabrosa]|nr:hypothetical protein C8Q76DRAFT_307613 [Earliella scabrosa]
MHDSMRSSRSHSASGNIPPSQSLLLRGYNSIKTPFVRCRKFISHARSNSAPSRLQTSNPENTIPIRGTNGTPVTPSRVPLIPVQPPRGSSSRPRHSRSLPSLAPLRGARGPAHAPFDRPISHSAEVTVPPSPLDSPQHMRHRLPIGAALPNKESMIRELEQLAASIPPIGVGELTRQYQARSPTRSVAATLKHKTSAYSIGGLSGYSEVASGYSVEMFPGEASDEQSIEERLALPAVWPASGHTRSRSGAVNRSLDFPEDASKDVMGAAGHGSVIYETESSTILSSRITTPQHLPTDINVHIPARYTDDNMTRTAAHRTRRTILVVSNPDDSPPSLECAEEPSDCLIFTPTSIFNTTFTDASFNSYHSDSRISSSCSDFPYGHPAPLPYSSSGLRPGERVHPTSSTLSLMHQTYAAACDARSRRGKAHREVFA